MQKCTTLETLVFSRHMSDHFTSDSLLRISDLPNLNSLNLQWMLESEIIQSVFSVGFQGFQSLRKLDMQIQSKDVPTLVNGITLVQDLALKIVDDDHESLCHIAKLGKLRRLIVTHIRGTRYSITELQSLQVLSQLQELRIGPSFHLYFEDVGDFTDESFKHFMSHFPQLRYLSLLMLCNLTVEGLRSISTSCPLLKSLRLLGLYDLRGLENLRSPAFPNLEVLELGEVGVRPLAQYVAKSCPSNSAAAPPN
ncbi:hypothetical protein MBLNU459_g2376t1 [Dothideomycetes sp. NU459]